jgi:aminomethyltransferase
MSDTILRTPLHGCHLEAGGRLVPFAGYEMPVQYDSVIAEAKAVREAAGMFDVSHMARLHLRGGEALTFLEKVTTNDVSKLVDGQGQYSLLPNPSGGCVDDIIVYRISTDHFRMVVNASNHQKDVAWLRSQNVEAVDLEDETERTAMIAVQGPKATQILADLSDAPQSLHDAGMFGVTECSIGGVPCFAARSGYTGEDGFELICSAGDAERLWGSLLTAGVKPCGLGARDVLRVEAGLPLYGHELDDELSPIAAGLGWVVSKTKAFIGSDRINEARAQGTPRKLQGVRLESKRVASPGMSVWVGERQVGEVTSGVYSPVLEAGIAFAFIDADVAIDTPCAIEIRGKHEPGTIVGKRFLKKAKAS